MPPKRTRNPSTLETWERVRAAYPALGELGVLLKFQVVPPVQVGTVLLQRCSGAEIFHSLSLVWAL